MADGFIGLKTSALGQRCRMKGKPVNIALKRIPKEGQHVTAEENCDPDEDGCSGNELCDVRSVSALIDRPGFIQQHEVENIDGAQDDQHHFGEEKESRVL